MAKKILTNASIVINGVNLSDHGNQVEVSSTKEVADVTGFGATNTQKLIGIGDASITMTFLQDYAAASVDATLWSIHSAGSEVVIVVKSDSGAVSVSNPAWTMTGILPEYTPLTGSMNDALTVDATFENSGSTGIVRTTA